MRLLEEVSTNDIVGVVVIVVIVDIVDVAVIVVILGRFKKASRLIGEEFEKVIANQSQLKSILIDDFLKKKWSSEI